MPAGNCLVARLAGDLAPGDALFIATADRSFLIEEIRPATIPGTILVTLDTGASTWTVPLPVDEPVNVECLH